MNREKRSSKLPFGASALIVFGYLGFVVSIATVMATALGVIGSAAIFPLLVTSFAALALGGIVQAV